MGIFRFKPEFRFYLALPCHFYDQYSRLPNSRDITLILFDRIRRPIRPYSALNAYSFLLKYPHLTFISPLHIHGTSDRNIYLQIAKISELNRRANRRERRAPFLIPLIHTSIVFASTSAEDQITFLRSFRLGV